MMVAFRVLSVQELSRERPNLCLGIGPSKCPAAMKSFLYKQPTQHFCTKFTSSVMSYDCLKLGERHIIATCWRGVSMLFCLGNKILLSSLWARFETAGGFSKLVFMANAWHDKNVCSPRIFLRFHTGILSCLVENFKSASAFPLTKSLPWATRSSFPPVFALAGWKSNPVTSSKRSNDSGLVPFVRGVPLYQLLGVTSVFYFFLSVRVSFAMDRSTTQDPLKFVLFSSRLSSWWMWELDFKPKCNFTTNFCKMWKNTFPSQISLSIVIQHALDQLDANELEHSADRWEFSRRTQKSHAQKWKVGFVRE